MNTLGGTAKEELAAGHNFTGQTANGNSRLHVGNNVGDRYSGTRICSSLCAISATNEETSVYHSYALRKTPGLFSRWTAERKNNIALLDAAAYAQMARLEKLLKNGVNLDYTNKDGLASIHLAIQNGHIDVVRTLLEAGANPGKQASKKTKTALMIAAESENADMIDLILDGGAPIEATMELCIRSRMSSESFKHDRWGGDYSPYGVMVSTALGFALHKGKSRAAKMLLDRGATAKTSTMKLEIWDKEERRRVTSWREPAPFPLLLNHRQQLFDDDVPVFETLLGRGEKIPKTLGGEHYILAAKGDAVQMMQWLWDHGAKLEGGAELGPLHQAVLEN